jgi:hypothetical protein
MSEHIFLCGLCGLCGSKYKAQSTEPDLAELVTTFFTGYQDLTRYLSAFCELTPMFFS